ncbi:MAG: mechanosensitive ion channel family protein [DPANN group archaeon]|nr:mechanosensitive ion channel family protein [DPANN group archaeon]
MSEISFIHALPVLVVVTMRFYFVDNVLYDEIFFAIILILAGLLLGKIVYLIFHRIFARIAAKTKTQLDDMIINAVKTPISVLVMLLGLLFGLLNISVLDSYDSWIRGIFWVVFALASLWVLRRLINVVLDWYADEIGHRTKSEVDGRIFPMLRKVINIVLYVILFIMILDHFNIEISPLIASLGVASLAVALALQDTLSNFFSGMYILADRPVQIGDYIKMDGGEEGYVEHIGWRSTRIRKLGNNYIILPNSKLANAVITNYNMPTRPLSVLTYCGVSYASDLEKVERISHDAAVKTRDSFEGAYKDFDPLIRFYEFGDSNINFKIIIRAKSYVDRFRLQHELIKNLKAAFDKEGIEISWPVRKVFYGNEKG